MSISVKQNNTYAAATGVWVKVNGVWKQVASDGLDGLGGWATLKRATGSPKRYLYTAGGTTWVAYEWTSNGSLTTDAGGLVEALLVAAGSSGQTTGGAAVPGAAGTVISGVMQVSASNNVSIGQPNVTGPIGGGSNLGSIGTGWSRAIYGGSNPNASQDSNADNIGYQRGWKSNITNTEIEYAVEARGFAPAGFSNPRANRGDGGKAGGGNNGSSGIVIARVPQQFDSVPSSDYVTRIDYYAEVTDGIVTDLYQERFYGDDTVRTDNGQFASPEQPDDLIPCDPTVAEGWTYADGEFTPPPPPPPPTRDQLIEALQEQIKDLQKDT